MEFLFFLLFFVLVIAAPIILIARHSSKKPVDQSAMYSQGYWDGYRAFGDKVTKVLERPKLDRNELQRAVNVGIFGSEQAPDNQAVSTVSVVSTTQAVATSNEVTAPPTPVDHSLRNSNILLYMASFLLVAAGAAFIGAAMPDTVKLIGIWALTLGFYAAGMWLYRKVEKLRPAAVAFTGTGLALLPFFGVALNQYGGFSVDAAWMTTSLIGLAMNFTAALALRSQVVSYLTMAFIISFASSAVATAALPIVWYFVVVISISLVASLIAFVAPKWMPSTFSEPVERTGQIVTPLALVASLFVFEKLSIEGYEVVFGAASAHYLVAWLQTHRRYDEHIARALVYILGFIVSWDMANDDLAVFGQYFLASAVLQGVISSMIIRWRGQTRRRSERVWATASVVLQLTAFLLWSGSPERDMLNAAGLAIVGICSVVLTYAFRDIKFAIPALFVSVVLPVQFGRLVLEPAIAWEWFEVLFIAQSLVALAVYHVIAHASSHDVRSFLTAAFWSYAFVSIVVSFLFTDHFYVFTALLFVSLLCCLASYIHRSAYALIGMTVAGTLAINQLLIGMYGYHSWTYIWTAWIAASLYYAGSWLMVMNRDLRRQLLLLSSTLVVLTLAILYGAVIGDHDTARASSWTIVAIGAILALEGERRGASAGLIEGAAYLATFGLQCVSFVDYPDTSFAIYGHWWAATILVAGLMRSRTYPRAYIAMGIITATTGWYALAEAGNYTLLFLIEHLLLLIVGAVRNRQWAIWWGIVASALAVLYFLRDIAYLAFAFLGLLIIGLVIWRLARQSKTVHEIDKPLN